MGSSTARRLPPSRCRIRASARARAGWGIRSPERRPGGRQPTRCFRPAGGERRGGRLGNVDVTVVAYAPVVGPRAAEISRNIALAFHVGHECVSVKATTNESLGALGRGEGIAALAVAMVETR